MTKDRFGWDDPQHWKGGWLHIYANPDDPRLWVRKRRPGLGWTLNVRHPKARYVLGGLAALIGTAAVLAALD
jgi:uncharacterized membrane protein